MRGSKYDRMAHGLNFFRLSTNLRSELVTTDQGLGRAVARVHRPQVHMPSTARLVTVSSTT